MTAPAPITAADHRQRALDAVWRGQHDGPLVRLGAPYRTREERRS